jgi:hypothetical protein
VGGWAGGRGGVTAAACGRRQSRRCASVRRLSGMATRCVGR